MGDAREPKRGDIAYVVYSNRREPRCGDTVFLESEGMSPDPAIVMAVGRHTLDLGVLGLGGRMDMAGIYHRDAAPDGEWQWWCWPDEVRDG